MKYTHSTRIRLYAAFFILLFCSTVYAGGEPKVEVCHAPPGNTANIHTIKIKESALAIHLAHGDLAGACNELCASLCDDGNACTIDDTDECEQNGCPVDRLPVDCSDGNLCTDDMCDVVSGCSNPLSVLCEPIDLCTASTCDPLVGTCSETPVMCDEGEVCNPDNGLCETNNTGTPDICPCFGGTTTEEKLLSLAGGGGIIPGECGADFPFAGVAAAFYANGGLACSGVDCGTSSPGVLSCHSELLDPETTVLGLTPDENAACQALITDSCPPVSSAVMSSSNSSVQYDRPLISN